MYVHIDKSASQKDAAFSNLIKVQKPHLQIKKQTAWTVVYSNPAPFVGSNPAGYSVTESKYFRS